MPAASKRVSILGGLVGLALLAGCATPDLRPFAEATKSLDAAVTTGGDLAIKPLARQPHWDGTHFVPPSDPHHPGKALTKSWNERRKTMDAVMAYSASLAAIAEASAKSKANAAELVDSVKQLASNVPGLSVGTGAGGDLLVLGLQSVIEVKASHDMAQAVAAANPAIQLVAKVLKENFASLSVLFESNQTTEIDQKQAALRPLRRFYGELQDKIKQQRAKITDGPVPAAVAAELLQLNQLVATVEPQLDSLQKQKSDLQAKLDDGKELFATAASGVDAWAAAHADLVKALEQNRSPNLVVLAARAEELDQIVQRLKK